MTPKEWLEAKRAELTPELELRRAAYEQMYGAVQIVDHLIANVPAGLTPEAVMDEKETTNADG